MNKTIILSVVFSIIASLLTVQTVQKFGSTVIETDSTDTLETFRTNVNSSLTSLQAFASSTSLVGITASTSPLGDIGIGTANATSSISGGNFCAFFQDEAGRGMWIKLAISGSQVFSTSTTACQ